jgi:hypothetical protein
MIKYFHQMHYDEEQNQFVISMQMKKAEWILLSLMVRPNKIKVLVLRQRRPSKFRPMGRFYCRTKKNRRRDVFLNKKKYSNFSPNLSFQACRWHRQVLTNVWMTDQSKTKVKIQHGYEWKHCRTVLVSFNVQLRSKQIVPWTILPVDRVNTIVLFVCQNSRMELVCVMFLNCWK